MTRTTQQLRDDTKFRPDMVWVDRAGLHEAIRYLAEGIARMDGVDTETVRLFEDAILTMLSVPALVRPPAVL
jgi:hypothetical protein